MNLNECKRTRSLNDITDTMDMSLIKLPEMVRTGKPGMLQSMGSQRVGHDRMTEQQQQDGFIFRSIIFQRLIYFSSVTHWHLLISIEESTVKIILV